MIVERVKQHLGLILGAVVVLSVAGMGIAQGSSSNPAAHAAKKKVKRGPPGPPGPQGLPGPQGIQGLQGQQGNAGPNLSVTQMTGASIDTFSIGTGGNLAVSGLSTSTDTNQNETLSSGVASTASNLEVKASTAPGSAYTWTFVLVVNGSPTPLTCPIGDLNTTCNDTTHTAAIPAGARVHFNVGASGPTHAARFEFGWTDTTP